MDGPKVQIEKKKNDNLKEKQNNCSLPLTALCPTGIILLSDADYCCNFDVGILRSLSVKPSGFVAILSVVVWGWNPVVMKTPGKDDYVSERREISIVCR